MTSNVFLDHDATPIDIRDPSAALVAYDPVDHYWYVAYHHRRIGRYQTALDAARLVTRMRIGLNRAAGLQ